MVGGPSIVFCRYAEAGISKIRSHISSDSEAGAKLRAKTCRAVLGFDANSLYLFCSGQEMPCGKEKVFQSEAGKKDELIQNVLNDKLFGFFQVDIEVPEQLLDKFSEFSPLFILSEVPEDQIPQHMRVRSQKFLSVFLIHRQDLLRGFQKKFHPQEEMLIKTKTKSNSGIPQN